MEVASLMARLARTDDPTTLYDPACGTGGMLSVAEEYLYELHPHARLEVFGQDYNNEAFAVCCSDMMIKGQDASRIVVNLLKELTVKEGCTVIMVTHDNRILELADRIVNMVDGRIVSNVVLRTALIISDC